MSKHTGKVEAHDDKIIVVTTGIPTSSGSIDHDSFQSWLELDRMMALKIFKGLAHALGEEYTHHMTPIQEMLPWKVPAVFVEAGSWNGEEYAFETDADLYVDERNRVWALVADHTTNIPEMED